ncbi:MAG: FAD-dependent oxidoreductase [Clostridia bacterium]|nr:FAD-dependent oxidoreductase [Clostridia bacterium]
MKKWIGLMLALMLVMVSAIPALAETYTGEAEGKNGKIAVEITVEDGKITDVQITEQVETAGLADEPLAQIPALVVENQSLAIDAFTGATVTSEALLAAIEAAAVKAGLDVEALKSAQVAAANAEIPAEETADVIVVGAGGAGLSAAAGAAQKGASVIVLEANGIVGGATIRSGGHLLVFDDAINASMDRNDEALQKYLDYNPAEFGEWAETLTTLQAQIKAYLESEQAGRFDSVEMALIDHYIKGQGKDLEGNEATNDFALLTASFNGTREINAWLQAGGMGIQEKMYNAHGGTPVGGAAALISTLQNMAESSGAKIILNMRATELIVEDGKVTGVMAQDTQGGTHTYHARGGVVLATGGFQSNAAMAAEYQKIGTGLGANNASTSPATNVGDGITMTRVLNAKLRDMGFMVTVMEGYHEGSSLSEFGKINANSQLTVNADAVRFNDDTKNAGMGTAGAAYINQPDGLIYFVGDVQMINGLNAAQEGFTDTMQGRGDWFVVRDTLEEAAEAMGLDAATLKATVETFNGYVDAGEDKDFGRTKFNGKVENGPFCIAKGEAHYHLTFGGLVINTDAQVLNEKDEVIAGLYAAGDVLSGLEGDAHQSGDCITTMLYFGKVAGEQAAESAK